MMGITAQMRLLVLSFALGIALMLIYDVIRFFRIVVGHGFWLVFIEDIIFWVIASGAIFALLFLENGGRIRFYAMAAVSVGMLLWYLIVGKRWQRFLYPKITKLKQNLKNHLKNIDKSKEES